jgi:hypothetical protein
MIYMSKILHPRENKIIRLVVFEIMRQYRIRISIYISPFIFDQQSISYEINGQYYKTLWNCNLWNYKVSYGVLISTLV